MPLSTTFTIPPKASTRSRTWHLGELGIIVHEGPSRELGCQPISSLPCCLIFSFSVQIKAFKGCVGKSWSTFTTMYLVNLGSFHTLGIQERGISSNCPRVGYPTIIGFGANLGFIQRMYHVLLLLGVVPHFLINECHKRKRSLIVSHSEEWREREWGGISVSHSGGRTNQIDTPISGQGQVKDQSIHDQKKIRWLLSIPRRNILDLTTDFSVFFPGYVYIHRSQF